MREISIRTIDSCRSCGSKNLAPILSLGDLYVSNFFDPGDEDKGVRAPLELILCGECGLLQLKHTVPGELLYRDYWYKSGVNATMTQELQGIAAKVKEIVPLKEGDFVIDIGANDGTLLRSYGVPGLRTVGFEPARNLEEEAKKGTTKIIVDFFDHAAWEKEFGGQKAKAITAIAMFYDLDDPNAFVRDAEKCLDDDGLFVIQMMYLPSFLARNAFDGICHEHLEYYSLRALENLLKRHGLEVCDVEMREHINEGSFRAYIRKIGKGASLRLSPGAEARVQAMREEEDNLGLGDAKTYEDFAKRVEDAKEKVMKFMKEEAGKGKIIHGYAASTKGNTTLQYYGITKDLVRAIADRNPRKWGKVTVGTGIPIVSETDSRAAAPDYYFILAWHFLPEFKEREKEFFARGGKFIVPMPEFEVI